MSSYRMDRTGEDIMRELTAILRTVKDPRVTGLISIVRVDVTRDLSYATVHISAMDGLDAAKAAVKGLTSAAGYMRRELGNALKLRHVPQLQFVADDSIAYSARIAQTLEELSKDTKKDGDSL
ncbi:MAG: 30S ribosome-binding factor RbfA [Clostridia bacterium]|nr:30S ribosome-binding factor RbfA [Clostridia bacterium]